MPFFLSLSLKKKENRGIPRQSSCALETNFKIQDTLVGLLTINYNIYKDPKLFLFST